MINKMFNNVNMLKAGLDASWLRNEVIANNIANVDTPNFKSSSVSFESAFKNALRGEGFTAKTTNARHFSDNLPRATVTQNTGTQYRMDGNNVNIDAENAALAKNQILYSTLARQLNSEFTKLKMAINEGR